MICYAKGVSVVTDVRWLYRQGRQKIQTHLRTCYLESIPIFRFQTKVVLNLYPISQGAEESNLRKITAKFPGKLRRRSSFVDSNTRTWSNKAPCMHRVLLRVCWKIIPKQPMVAYEKTIVARRAKLFDFERWCAHSHWCMRLVSWG